MKDNGIIALFAVIVLMAGGCASIRRVVEEPRVLTHRSDVQTLQIKNTHGADINIASCTSNSQPLVLPDGGMVSIEFVVNAITDLYRPDSQSPWYRMADTHSFSIESLGGRCQFKMKGDFVIELGSVPGGTPSEIRLSLMECPPDKGWGDLDAPAATYQLESKGIAGIPNYLCPKLP